MIMGTNCTRNCRFCNVTTAKPQALDVSEPENIAHAVHQLDLQYVVITSVTRDDLNDGGAAHFAATIRAIRKLSPTTAVEVLIPDFKGYKNALRAVTEAAPDVISHNMETVASLYPQVRIGADYQRSLELIATIKQLAPNIKAKSGIMLGLGETEKQVLELFDDLLEAGCELLTIGQYLAPSLNHYPVQDFIAPEMFEEYGDLARQKGFSFVASAPLVRSSYQAEEALS
jgi:lipoic acid synthetase